MKICHYFFIAWSMWCFDERQWFCWSCPHPWTSFCLNCSSPIDLELFLTLCLNCKEKNLYNCVASFPRLLVFVLQFAFSGDEKGLRIPVTWMTTCRGAVPDSSCKCRPLPLRPPQMSFMLITFWKEVLSANHIATFCTWCNTRNPWLQQLANSGGVWRLDYTMVYESIISQEYSNWQTAHARIGGTQSTITGKLRMREWLGDGRVCKQSALLHRTCLGELTEA